MMSKRILVLGAGPAGGAVAIGLRRMGYPVTVVSEPRPFDAVEGISARAIEGLRGAGFQRALERVASASPRQVTWNGQTSAANTEHLVVRQRFDAALLEDLSAEGITVIEGRVKRHRFLGERHVIEVEADTEPAALECEFLVEARGRAAPAAGVPRVQGRKTLSLLQYWQGPVGPARSAVQSFAEGWAWLAQCVDGRRYLQLTVDADSTRLPPKQALGDWCRTRLEQLEQAQPFIEGAEPVGEVRARISTPVLCERIAGDNWIRVGDAAMAVDPLSGNGIFQALSSALQAPAVVNTLLQNPEQNGLACQFHEQRIEGLFYRFARIGRDFYAQESQWPDQAFWQKRSHWPDTTPLHSEVTPDKVTTDWRPVVQDGLITQVEVVITPDQPLGIWHLNGLELAPLLRRIRAQHRPVADVLGESLGAERGVQLAHWMLQQGWV
ncbi:FAD-dependent monooxygenase [Vreelandella rituensis]|uniref:FAD-dependent oxidoreductase n=1 Tax=Vreelandella rituensis TaxID=2282306 RepID=A0A368TR86_9GAMM|nr:FAD-dependent monooxygenase [Halomonas rituensis]RCV87235.1 FAD-dependent oxidoreductase [Halomonas rituensis]